MLGQIELGQSAPTINVAWKISSALGVPFSALLSERVDAGPHLLRAADSKRLTSHDGKFVSRALFPYDERRRVELVERRRVDPRAEGAGESGSERVSRRPGPRLRDRRARDERDA